ncbi:hypothetical protein QOZ80_7AG0553600 [Eleusine coracana subsp. coracana]|nr:hypothetical protein QOZ80_7AG0553600 [Eleusine coracana subsp. coracana]
MEPAAALTADLVDEILLRLPPRDPASLVRAALVCKAWLRLVSGAGFRRRFRALHRTPPMLGFLCNLQDDDPRSSTNAAHNTRFVSCLPSSSIISHRRFVPKSSASSWRRCVRGWRAIDARHGRVLLHSMPWGIIQKMVVWDPITDEQTELPELPQRPDPYHWGWNAAVMCAVDDGRCDHLDCHRGLFRVVFVGCCVSSGIGMFSRVYSSESGVWSEQLTSANNNIYGCLRVEPCVLVRNALYFRFKHVSYYIILKYDLSSRQISGIPMIPGVDTEEFMLTGSEDGGLGFAGVEDSKLYLLSNEDTTSHHRWTQSRVINLRTLLPVDALATTPRLVGFADALSVLILWTGHGFFAINTKSLEVINIAEGNREEGSGTVYNVVPFLTFYTPLLGVDVRKFVLTASQDDRLGFAAVEGSELCLWLKKSGSRNACTKQSFQSPDTASG